MKLTVPTYALYRQPFQSIEARYIHMEDMAEFRSQHHQRTAPHRHHGLIHMVWLNRGSIHGLIEDQPLDLAAPALLVIPPLSIHSFDLTRSLCGKNLTVGEDLVAEIAGYLPRIKSLLLGQPITLTCTQLGANAADIHRQFEAIWKEFSCAHNLPHQQAVLFGQIMQAFGQIAPLDTTATPNPAHHQYRHRLLYQRFHALVAEHYDDSWPISEYARHLSVSTRNLQRACRAVCGLTPVQILHTRLMLEAQRLLWHTEKSVNTIAYQLGFDDPGYFTHFFTRHLDMSPTDYRTRKQTMMWRRQQPAA